MPVTEQDYRNIIAKMRVDPIFKSLVTQIVRDNIETLTSPMIREIDQKIVQATQQKKTYY